MTTPDLDLVLAQARDVVSCDLNIWPEKTKPQMSKDLTSPELTAQVVDMTFTQLKFAMTRFINRFVGSNRVPGYEPDDMKQECWQVLWYCQQKFKSDRGSFFNWYTQCLSHEFGKIAWRQRNVNPARHMQCEECSALIPIRARGPQCECGHSRWRAVHSVAEGISFTAIQTNQGHGMDVETQYRPMNPSPTTEEHAVMLETIQEVWDASLSGYYPTEWVKGATRRIKAKRRHQAREQREQTNGSSRTRIQVPQGARSS